MNPDEGAAARDVEAEETDLDPEHGSGNDSPMELIGSPRELITLALMAAAVIAFLALCLPMYIL